MPKYILVEAGEHALSQKCAALRHNSNNAKPALRDWEEYASTSTGLVHAVE